MRGGFVFFRAEDGIRDAQESRGLGDVYKRQDALCSRFDALIPFEQLSTDEIKQVIDRLVDGRIAVSYTHLTLPTIYSV
mgnify:CR=1 FL=1